MSTDNPNLIPRVDATTSPTRVLHPELGRQIQALYDGMVARGSLFSVEKLAGFYSTFRDRFGPDVLGTNDGESLLQLIHGRANRDSLVYWLEFKDDEEFPGGSFGSIAGGSALKFGLYQRRETGAWMRGSAIAQQEISTVEAVSITRTHRDQLLAACDVLKAFGPSVADEAYAALERDLGRGAPNVSDYAWGRKYLSLLFPDKLDDFHAPSYQHFNLIKLLEIPPEGGGRYACSGRFVALAAQFGWPMNHFTGVLNERHGNPRRYWRIGTRSGGSDAQSYWPMMQERSVVAIGWSRLGDLSAAPPVYRDFKEAIRTAMAREYPNSPQVTGRSVRQVAQFCRIIEDGDYILVSDGARVLGIGRVRGAYEFDATQGFPHMRPVEWLDIGEWQLPTTEGLQTTVHECKEHPANLVAVEKRLLERSGARPPQPVPSPQLRRSVDARARRWTDGGILGRVQDILERKGQAILYGPPGTGKTHWAENAARQLAALQTFGRKYEELLPEERTCVSGTGQDSLVRFCCFHPAYGYEDFLEGYRPVSRGDALHFELQDGLFKILCDAAASAPSRSFYLVIDEINRGDIPRIFGELVTLLEKPKRGLRVKLPLSGRDFFVPPNVFVIGTMNTADRSIALLDAALRRRFGFIELMPDSTVLGDTVVGGIPLGPWLDALNRLVAAHVGRDGRNLQVGHSYFLHEGRPIDSLSKLSRVLLDDVFPLLEEYCYDDWETLERILGPRLVDVTDGRFRMDVFEPGRQDALVQALLALAPEVSASAIAVAADSAPQDSGDEPEGESV